jgi:hypothetical protein
MAEQSKLASIIWLRPGLAIAAGTIFENLTKRVRPDVAPSVPLTTFCTNSRCTVFGLGQGAYLFGATVQFKTI